MRGIKVYCFMSSSNGGIDEYTSDLIMVNAYDMWQRKSHHQLIRAGKCDGVIRSKLQVVRHFNVPIVVFEVLISNNQWEANEIRCYIRVDDLNVPPTVERMNVCTNSGLMIPFDFVVSDDDDD